MIVWGAVAAGGGGGLLAAAHSPRLDELFAIIAGAGIIAAITGVRARSYASRARPTLRNPPLSLTLTTRPYSPKWPFEFLRAIILGEPPNPRASFRVAWGTFGAKPLDQVPANVYGDLTPGSIALVACGAGFVLGKVDRNAKPMAPIPEHPLESSPSSAELTQTG